MVNGNNNHEQVANKSVAILSRVYRGSIVTLPQVIPPPFVGRDGVGPMTRRRVSSLQQVFQKYLQTKTKSPKRNLRALKVAATYSPTTSAVPSAWLSLTTLFGMGRGGTSAL